MITNTLIFKMLKYIALGSSLYLIFRFIPSQSTKWSNTDILIIVSIILLVYILFENLFGSQTMTCPNQQNQLTLADTTKLCSTVCSLSAEQKEIKEKEMKETMESTPPIKQDEQKPDVRDAMQTKLLEKEANRQNSQKVRSYKDNINLNTVTSSTQIDKPDAERGIERKGSREKDDVITDDMEYTDYNHLPMADNYDTGDFEYGYSFLPPEKWYPQPPYPPVCVAEKRCPVCPILTTGTPADAKEWHASRRITQPDTIKTAYIKEKLNSGK